MSEQVNQQHTDSNRNENANFFTSENDAQCHSALLNKLEDVEETEKSNKSHATSCSDVFQEIGDKNANKSKENNENVVNNILKSDDVKPEQTIPEDDLVAKRVNYRPTSLQLESVLEYTSKIKVFLGLEEEEKNDESSPPIKFEKLPIVLDKKESNLKENVFKLSEKECFEENILPDGNIEVSESSTNSDVFVAQPTIDEAQNGFDNLDERNEFSTDTDLKSVPDILESNKYQLTECVEDNKKDVPDILNNTTVGNLIPANKDIISDFLEGISSNSEKENTNIRTDDSIEILDECEISEDFKNKPISKTESLGEKNIFDTIELPNIDKINGHTSVTSDHEELNKEHEAENLSLNLILGNLSADPCLMTQNLNEIPSEAKILKPTLNLNKEDELECIEPASDEKENQVEEENPYQITHIEEALRQVERASKSNENSLNPVNLSDKSVSEKDENSEDAAIESDTVKLTDDELSDSGIFENEINIAGIRRLSTEVVNSILRNAADQVEEIIRQRTSIVEMDEPINETKHNEEYDSENWIKNNGDNKDNNKETDLESLAVEIQKSTHEAAETFTDKENKISNSVSEDKNEETEIQSLAVEIQKPTHEAAQTFTDIENKNSYSVYEDKNEETELESLAVESQKQTDEAAQIFTDIEKENGSEDKNDETELQSLAVKIQKPTDEATQTFTDIQNKNSHSVSENKNEATELQSSAVDFKKPTHEAAQTFTDKENNDVKITSQKKSECIEMENMYNQRSCNNLINDGDEPDMEHQCGLGLFKPDCLQQCANAKTYLVLYSIIGILHGSYYTYLVGVLSTLEKRFAFKSKTSGFIMMLDELTPLFLGILVGHYSNRAHRPRLLSFGMFLSAFCCFASALPYFLYGTATHLSTANVHNKTSTEFCNSDIRQEHCDLDDRPPTMTAILLLMLGSFLKGFGNLAYYAIGLAYLDDNSKKKNTPLYFAVAFSLRLLGPMVGFLMSSAFLKYYENPLDDPGYGPEDPRWIGGWWMGFVLQGILLLIFAGPLAFFPRRLPGFKPITTETNASDRIFDGLFDALKRLVKNPLYLLIVLNSIFTIYGNFGFYIMLPKYMENQFRFTASNASLVAGPPGISALMVSIVIGGFLIWKYKPSAKFLAAGLIIMETISAVGYIILMFPQCEKTEMAHYGFGDDSLILEDKCNINCNCTTISYTPICGSDQKTYFSPCYAGCAHMNKSYSGCSCMENFNENAIITPGVCISDSCWSQALIYITIIPIKQFIINTLRVAHTMILLRSNKSEDKNIALGVFETVISTVAFIPFPVLYGALVDSSCLVWEKNCDETGNCWFYDIQKFNYYMHGASALFCGLSIFSVSGIYLLVHRVGDLYEDDIE